MILFITVYLQETVILFEISLSSNNERKKENREIGRRERMRKICVILLSNYVVDRLRITIPSAGRAINASAKAGAKMRGAAEVGLINF